ncbi:MAG: hypothetical protein WCH11_06620, partial [Bdellovibrio sp.]
MIRHYEEARRWTLGLFVGSSLISQTLMDFISFVFVSLSILVLWQGSRIESQPDNPKAPSAFPYWLRIWFLLFCGFVLVSIALNWSLIPNSEWTFRRLGDLKWILFLFLFFDTLQSFSWKEEYLRHWSWFLCFIGIVGTAVSFLGFDPWKGPEYHVTPIGNNWIRTGGFLSNPMTFA